MPPVEADTQILRPRVISARTERAKNRPRPVLPRAPFFAVRPKKQEKAEFLKKFQKNQKIFSFTCNVLPSKNSLYNREDTKGGKYFGSFNLSCALPRRAREKIRYMFWQVHYPFPPSRRRSCFNAAARRARLLCGSGSLPVRKMGAAVLKRWTFRAFWSKIITLAPVAQLDRVSDSDSEGHRFDSCRVYQTPEAFFASGVSVSAQESYPTLTRLPHKKSCVYFAGTPGNIACELYIAAAKSDVRKRCRHFAVPSPLGLLTPPAGCTTLPPFLRRELLLGGKTVCYF